MKSPVPMLHFQSQAPAEDTADSGPGPTIQAFKPLAPRSDHPDEGIRGSKLSGLAEDLSSTLDALKKELAEDASRRGGPPGDFLPISRDRWRVILGIKSKNSIKTRLDRLEEMGLIEVRPGERGSWGTSLNCYRLRSVGDGQAEPQTIHSVIETRGRETGSKRQAGKGRTPGNPDPLTPGGLSAVAPLTPGGPSVVAPMTPGGPSVEIPLTPGGPSVEIPLTPGGPSAETSLTPGGSPVHPPALVQNKSSTSVQNQSIHQSTFELNELIEKAFEIEREKMKKEFNKSISINSSIIGIDHQNEKSIDELIDRTSDLNPGLKVFLRGSDPEPWPHHLRLGLSEILDPDTVPLVEERSPWSAQGAWAILETIRMKGRKLGNRAGTLWNALLQPEKGAAWLAKAGSCSGLSGWRQASGDGVAADPRGSVGGGRDLGCRTTQDAGSGARAKRPEDLSPQVKAQLRELIEDFRVAFNSFMQSAKSDQKDALDAFARTFQCAADALEPVLPLQVTLLDEFHPTRIQGRKQIKTNILGAVYRAIS